MAREEQLKFSLIDGVTAGLSKIAAGIGGIKTTFTELNQAAELASKGIGLVRDVAAGIGNAVGGAADLETALSRVADITRATAAEQEALRAAVDSAVYDVGASAQEASAALVLMAEDGFSAQEAIDNLATVLSYAKANAQDAATATGALGGVLDTFGEKPQIIGQLADQLTAASRAAGVGSQALQQGLAAIGVQAEQAGLGVSETLAALSTLASRGIEGTQAAKQLGTALTDLQNPASKAGKAIVDAGLAGKSFGEVIEALSKDSSKAAPVLEALGTRPRAALRILLEDGGGALNEFRGIVNGAAGDSERAAAVVGETFNGALAKLQNTVEQARNAFLQPLLTPLADEFNKLSGKIAEFAQSEQFTRLSEQVTGFVTSAVSKLGEFVAAVDFEELARKAVAFGDRFGEAFRALEVVVVATANTIRGIATAIEYVQDKADEFARWAGVAERDLGGLRNVADQTGRSLSKLGPEFEKGSKKTRELGQAAADAAPKATELAGAVDEAGKAAGDAAEDLRRVPEAAKLSVGTLDEVKRAANEAAIAFERVKLVRLGDALADLARQGQVGSAAFQGLLKASAETEARITKLTEEQSKLAKANKDTADTANNAANSLRNMAGAARDAEDAAESAASSNSQVADSFGNIGNQASETAISLGNLTEAFVRQALEAAGSAKSARDYIDTLNSFFAAGADEEEKILARLELLKRQNALLDEEGRLRKQLELQYGTSSRLIDELVVQEKKLRDAKKETNDEAERGIEIEQRRVAGALNPFQQAVTPETPSATGGRGTAGGEGSRAPAQIIVNVQGMTTDQAREFVARSVVPELERLNRLSR